MCVCFVGTLKKSKINQAGLRLPQLANLILVQSAHNSCFPLHSIFLHFNLSFGSPFFTSFLFFIHPLSHIFDFIPNLNSSINHFISNIFMNLVFFLESFLVTTLLFSYTPPSSQIFFHVNPSLKSWVTTIYIYLYASHHHFCNVINWAFYI